MWSTIITSAVTLVKGWFDKKAKETEAKHEAKMKHMDKIAEWEITQAEASKTSWKDEWFTVILSVPLVGAFVPPLVPYVQEGFVVLSSMPDYYKAFLGGAVAASFGLKTLANWKS